MREQVVAEQDARLDAPAGVDRRHVPAHRGAVEDVVVDQRGRVDHLHHGAEDVVGRRRLAAGAGRQQQQHRPQPLAAVVADVIDHRLNLGIAALQCLRQDALDFFQVGRDGPYRSSGRRDRLRDRQHRLVHERLLQTARRSPQEVSELSIPSECLAAGGAERQSSRRNVRCGRRSSLPTGRARCVITRSTALHMS